VYGDIRKCKIRNWEQKSKNREDWMRSKGEGPHEAVESTKKKKNNKNSNKKKLIKQVDHIISTY
jgi:hypothetical protein